MFIVVQQTLDDPQITLHKNTLKLTLINTLTH
jgi:hypothetical protein